MRAFALFAVALVVSGLLSLGESFGAAASHTTRTDTGGGVTVKVTYLDPKSTNELRFQVALNTHSVNLDSYDLKKISLLRDDAGNTYLPTGVENKGGGHHRESTLSFANIANGTKRLELVIKDVAGIKERIFRWDLE